MSKKSTGLAKFGFCFTFLITSDSIFCPPHSKITCGQSTSDNWNVFMLRTPHERIWIKNNTIKTSSYDSIVLNTTGLLRSWCVVARVVCHWEHDRASRLWAESSARTCCWNARRGETTRNRRVTHRRSLYASWFESTRVWLVDRSWSPSVRLAWPHIVPGNPVFPKIHYSKKVIKIKTLKKFIKP